MAGAATKVYQTNEVEIDVSKRVVRRAGAECGLRPKIFCLLIYLIEHRDRVVPKEELMEQLWPGVAVSDSALAQGIACVRRALGEDPRYPIFIRTVARVGYQFIAPIDETAASVAEASPNSNRLWRRVVWLVAGVMIAGSLAAGVFWNAIYHPPGTAQKRVVAIVPFENRSGQRDLDWLREGLPDMLSTTLSRSQSLEVLSREPASARRKRGDALVTGSFSKLGNSMRVDVRISDPATGSLLGTERITVDQEDRILTQVDILAVRLASRLGPQAPDRDQRALGSLMTDNLEAYRYYSLGLEKTYGMQTPQAVALFQKALALDPGFVMAQARIGYAYAVTGSHLSDLKNAKPYLEKAFRMSGKLIDKDRRHIVAWYALANQDYQNAIRSYSELIAEYPNDVEACFRLAALLRGESRHEEALEFLNRANAIDAEDPKIYNSLAAVYSEMGRHVEALAMAGRYVALVPGDANAYDSLGLAYYMAGQYGPALEAYGKALELKPDFAVASLHRAQVYAAQGRLRDSVRESFMAGKPGVVHDACRGFVQVSYVLWRNGRTEEAKGVAARPLSDCLVWPALLAVGKPATPNSTALLTSLVGRGARFGHRTRYFNEAQYAKQQGRTQDQLANLRQLLAAKPGWGEIDIFEDALGDAYLELGRVDEAISEYERALRLFPGMARARYHLGQAYMRKGQKDLAIAQFREFLNIWKHADPDLPEMAEVRRWVQ